MKTLREIFGEFRSEALEDVFKHIEENGYIDPNQVHNYFQKRISDFERYYIEELDIDPFSEEFANHEFHEYFRTLKDDEKIEILETTGEKWRGIGFDEIYGFNKKEMKKNIEPVRKRM